MYLCIIHINKLPDTLPCVDVGTTIVVDYCQLSCRSSGNGRIKKDLRLYEILHLLFSRSIPFKAIFRLLENNIVNHTNHKITRE